MSNGQVPGSFPSFSGLFIFCGCREALVETVTGISQKREGLSVSISTFSGGQILEFQTTMLVREAGQSPFVGSRSSSISTQRRLALLQAGFF
jgi:hypothetical protein